MVLQAFRRVHAVSGFALCLVGGFGGVGYFRYPPNTCNYAPGGLTGATRGPAAASGATAPSIPRASPDRRYQDQVRPPRAWRRTTRLRHCRKRRLVSLGLACGRCWLVGRGLRRKKGESTSLVKVTTSSASWTSLRDWLVVWRMGGMPIRVALTPNPCTVRTPSRKSSSPDTRRASLIARSRARLTRDRGSQREKRVDAFLPFALDPAQLQLDVREKRDSAVVFGRAAVRSSVVPVHTKSR